MTLDQLEIMELIVEKGSFKAAAEHLHRTQPTLSIAIKKLETEFSITIFNRETYRPTLTDEGRVFLNWARPCLDAFRKLQVVGEELGTQKVEVELLVGVDPLVRWELLRGLFESCLSKTRPTELVLSSVILDQGLEQVADGSLHFAISPKRFEHSGIESLLFDRVTLMPVINRQLADGLSSFDPAWLREQPQIVVRSSTEPLLSGSQHDLGLLKGGKRFYVGDHGMKKELIMRGIGWGRLALHEIAKELESGELIPIDDPSVSNRDLELCVMRKLDRPLGPVSREFWTMLEKLAQAQNAKLSSLRP